MTIELTGPDGNAFFLLAQARKLSRELDLPQDKVYTEMTGGDYTHLVNTFLRYFGDMVTLTEDGIEIDEYHG